MTWKIVVCWHNEEKPATVLSNKYFTNTSELLIALAWLVNDPERAPEVFFKVEAFQ